MGETGSVQRRRKRIAGEVLKILARNARNSKVVFERTPFQKHRIWGFMSICGETTVLNSDPEAAG